MEEAISEIELSVTIRNTAGSFTQEWTMSEVLKDVGWFELGNPALDLLDRFFFEYRVEKKNGGAEEASKWLKENLAGIIAENTD